MVQAPSLAALPWVRHGFSTRQGGTSTVYGQPGDLNLGFTREDDRPTVEQNRRIFLQSVAPGADWPLLTTRQIHSDRTLVVTDPAQPLDPADGLATHLPGVFLAMLTADCVPVLLADPVHRAIGVFHAGWRGTVARVVEKGVQTMRETYGSRPEDLIAAIGPSIGPCCYVVGEEVHSRFQDAFAYAPSLFRGGNLDLWQANRQQLLSAGVPSSNISIQNLCTASTGTPARRMFFSYRAEAGVTGRMMSAIAIVPQAIPLP